MEMAGLLMTLTTDQPIDFTVKNIKAQKTHFATWKKSNQICLLFIKCYVQKHLKSGLLANCTAKQMMEALVARNCISSNVEIGTHLQTLFNMKYDGFGGVRDYVLRMVDLQTKHQALNTLLPD